MTSACFKTSASNDFFFLISSNSGTSLNDSIRVTPGLSGISLANLSVSLSGSSSTLPASLIADLAAILPYVII